MTPLGCEKLLVIGLDGGTFTLLRPWMAEGNLPNLAGLAATGVSGVLESTCPPLTAPAWSSFMTGMNPGKHGIFDFHSYEPGSYNRVAVNSRCIGPPTLWSVASSLDRQVIVCNVPMTYPPRPVNGVMISGRIVPHRNSIFTYPPDLDVGITTDAGSYVVDVDWEHYGEDRTDEFLAELTKCTASRAQAFLHVMHKYRWDLGVLVFTGTDMIQHCCWAYCDPAHPRYSETRAEKYRPQVVAYFRLVDELIGRILQEAGETTNVIVMSDHGFGPLHAKLNLNQYLAESGLFARRYTTADSLRTVVIADTARRASAGLSRLLTGKSLGTGLGTKLGLKTVTQVVDWRRTKAYADSYRSIRVNLVGREPQGTVRAGPEYERLLRDLTCDLLELTDPQNGSKLIEGIYRGDEIYSGPYVGCGPDLVLEFGDRPYDAYGAGYENEDLFDCSAWHTGSHRREGILIATGPNVRSGKVIHGARLVDLAATSLHILGCRVPRGMDGKVLESIFLDHYVGSNPPLYAERHEIGNGQSEMPWAGLEGEQEVVLEKLRGLGYLE